jgi:hypothetical protein
MRVADGGDDGADDFADDHGRKVISDQCLMGRVCFWLPQILFR